MEDEIGDFDYLEGPAIWNSNIEIYCNPKIWWAHASSLKNSADIIYEEHYIYDEKRKHRYIHPNVEKMLYGFSFECLMKAVIIANDPSPTKLFENDQIKQFMKTHNLLELIKKVDYDPKPSEIIILEELTTCSTWAGRYPIPAKAKSLPKERKPETSLEIQIKKMNARFEKYQSEGKPMTDLWDLLHQGIGNEKKTQIDEMYNNIFSLIPKEKFH